MAQNAQERPPQFDDAKIYILRGKTLNAIVKSIIREILTDSEDIAVEDKGDGKIKLVLQGTWTGVTNCDGETMDVLARNIEDAG